jgi:class 3 adenylate cyclase/tetratricopeptide (TPR) repeat protein
MQRCAGCGAGNPDGHRFCSSCGAALTGSCPACGAPAAPDQRFCGACGQALEAAPPAPVGTPKPSAERRVCSVLFADLVGFTPLSESRDAEQVRELLSEYFDSARTVITRYGGVVEKFIGDAVMAVWGTPVATEGDAERAVRAALEVVDTVADLGERLGLAGLSARAGVVTGEVAVTLGASSEGMVAGDAVNTAARVQSAAEPGTVLVDEASHRLASAAIAFSDAGEHTLKGKSAPVPLWRATRVLANVGGVQRVDGLEAPLVGRDAELRTIKELFHASAERRTPRLVVVSGPAGIGKSRLGWEFEKYVDGLVETCFWHRGRCLSYGDGVSFWALAEIVRQRFGIAEEDDPLVAATTLRDRLGEFVPDPTERAYVGPRLGRLLGVPYDETDGEHLGREELFAGWRVFFERLARVEPVILLIEDAQHADAALLDFVDHFIDWARDVPVYVLMFGRPELLEHRPGWGAGRNRTVLTLDPLDARSMDTLLGALVSGLPAAATRAIAEQAQGNPLFAVETIRSLIDRDAVVPIDGVYRLVGSVGELSVPDSLHAVLAARLDALAPDLRALVADAAVLGSTFPAEALVVVSGRPPAELEPLLAELVRRGVLEVSADPLSPQRGNYQFSQNLLRHVAYETLSRRDRKARHLAVAAHLRGAFANDGEEVSDVVARHYLDALDAVPDDPDVATLREQAVDALVRAADRAERSGATAHASRSLHRAGELVAETPGTEAALKAAALWERASRLYVEAGLFEEAVERAERARATYDTHGEPRAAARAQTYGARALGLLGRITEARAMLGSALETLRAEVDADMVNALAQLAGLEIFVGDPTGPAHAEEALLLGQEVEVPTGLLAHLFIIRGLGHSFSNRVQEAIAALEFAARLAERAGDSQNQARALLNLSSLFVLSDARSSADAASASAELARRVGSRNLLSIAVGNLFMARLMQGDWDAAQRVLDDSVQRDALDNDPFLGANLALLAALRGEVEAARAHAAIPRFRDSEDAQECGWAAIVDLFIAQASGRPDEVAERAEEALGFAGALGLGHEVIFWAWPAAVRAAFDRDDLDAVRRHLELLDSHPLGHVPPLLRAERSLARARLAAARDEPDADGPLAAAVAKLRTAGSPYHLAHALLDLADHRARTGTDDAGVLVDEAELIAARLAAGPLAERAHALRLRLPVRSAASTPAQATAG